jgi:hypothetical protein
MNRSVILCSIIVALGIGTSVGATAAQGIEFLEKRPQHPEKLARPVAYWNETRAEPRPLRIHVVRVDLQARNCEVAALTRHTCRDR